MVQQTVDHGFNKYFIKKAFRFLGSIYPKKIVAQDFQTLKPLNINQIKGFFWLYMYGMVLSSGIFLLELVWKFLQHFIVSIIKIVYKAIIKWMSAQLANDK